ncbi:ScyD/ScyE family protein [Cryobacterium breve]|uniref:ScyD/ScyE family protein n=1 Tax=Cryobacterium breve TaxID=1259258 RepID=A0ABY7NES1_9MICO|nr:ScyD/ScyE family protein [Cryobacterium breve]WBM80272.1 ScyD/ScyE family protein [Cryobacterium breve]
MALFGAAPATAGQKSGHDDGTGDGSGTGTPVTLAEGLLGPLSLEVGRHNTVYVTQNFAGELTKVARDGTTSTLASAPGEEISAVTARKGTVYYARVAQDHSAATLRSIAPDGTDAELADIAAYEKSANPDQNNSYGFVDLDPTCAAQFDPTQPPSVPATYTGVVDTHPYASLALWNGVYVADAGGNAILHVDWDGTVSTTAVLPPSEPVTIDAAMIADIGFPACAAGHEYRFEPVPTDVELGPDGWLYVTSLPGGPEDASLGARGSVYRVDPDSGEVERVATGFVGATGLAVSQDDGTIYVAELFGGPAGTGQVSVLEPGSDTPSALVAVSQPAAIEPATRCALPHDGCDHSGCERGADSGGQARAHSADGRPRRERRPRRHDRLTPPPTRPVHPGGPGRPGISQLQGSASEGSASDRGAEQ